MLLFVRNVRKISLSVIDKKGQFKTKFAVEKEMTEENEAKKRYNDAVVKAARVLKEYETKKQPERNVFSLETVEEVYDLKIKVNKNISLSYIVCEGVGFRTQNPDLKQRYAESKAALLPRGGVAYQLPTPEAEDPPPTSIFCFLPLPKKSPFPVHVNAHFVLSSESREDIYRRDDSSFKSLWNQHLLRDVIASTYIAMLTELSRRCVSPGRYSDVLPALTSLTNALPCQPVKVIPQELQVVQSTLYSRMAHENLQLLPVVTRRGVKKDGKEFVADEEVMVEWKGVKDFVFFDDIKNQVDPKENTKSKDEQDDNHAAASKRKETERSKIEMSQGDKLVAILKNLHFPFIHLDLKFLDLLKESCPVEPEVFSLPSLLVTPQHLLTFLRKLSQDFDCSDVNIRAAFPRDVSKTPFLSSNGVQIAFSYIQELKNEPNFCGLIEDSPLLLTQDKVLRTFEKSQEKILASEHFKLLPELPHRFMHQMYSTGLSLYPRMLEEAMPEFVKEMDVTDFEALLPHHLPVTHFRDVTRAQFTDVTKEMRWLADCYKFLHSKCFVPQLSSGIGKLEYHGGELQPMMRWCIVPTQSHDETYLSKLQDAHLVLSSRKNSSDVLDLPVPRTFTGSDAQEFERMLEVLDQHCRI